MINPLDINMARFNLQNQKIEDPSKFAGTKGSQNATEESLKKAACDFEAVFVKQLLDIMDSTVQKSEFMRGGQAENIFKSMMNEEISKEIASSPSSSFGLAEQVYKQMKDRL